MGALLEVRGLSRRFGGIFANRSVSFDVPEGRIVALIGPNGAGKTTLFNLITGFLRPDEGTVLFEGREVTGLAPDRLSRLGIARTFQMLKPFPRLSVTENVMVGALAHGENLAAARKRAHHCLEMVGIAHKAADLAGNLSTGQRKRLEMARAMATRPRLLMLDEITGGVDQPSIPGLIELVAALRREGTTLLIIEHNMRVVMQLADWVVFLHLGEKIAEGPAAEIARHPVVTDIYLGSAGAQHS